MDLLFVLQRGQNAVEWSWMTDYYPSQGKRGAFERRGLGDVRYHATKAQYEGQEPVHDDCKFTGGVCYSDSSALQSEDFFALLISQPEKVWEKLEEWLQRVEAKNRQEAEMERNFS